MRPPRWASRRDHDFMVCSSRILVGAPQAAGQGPLRGSRPGALFRCPITPEEYDCERVDIDGEGGWKMTLHQRLERPHQCRSEWVHRWAYFHGCTFNFPFCFTSVSLNRESKHNQWLGVTVKSQGIGGKVVVRDQHQLMKAPGPQTTQIPAQSH